MDAEEENNLNDFLKKQINELPLILNEELIYKNQKFNHRTDFKEIKNLISDFLNGENIVTDIKI